MAIVDTAYTTIVEIFKFSLNIMNSFRGQTCLITFGQKLEIPVVVRQMYNLFVTSKKRNHQFTDFKKCCKRPECLIKPLFNGVLFLIYYFNNHFKPCFFLLKALKDILQHFKFVN